MICVVFKSERWLCCSSDRTPDDGMDLLTFNAHSSCLRVFFLSPPPRSFPHDFLELDWGQGVDRTDTVCFCAELTGGEKSCFLLYFFSLLFKCCF